jgi:hypothetical protein
MDVLNAHLRTLAATRLGSGDGAPHDPGVARRCQALGELADLLETDPSLVRKAVRQTLDEYVLEGVPGDTRPPLHDRAATVLTAHGWDGPVALTDHLQLLDRLAAAVMHDMWDTVRGVGGLLLRRGETADDIAAGVGLHGFEVDLALCGVAPTSGTSRCARRCRRRSAGKRSPS